MWRQNNMPQMKKQENSPKTELSKMEASNLPDKELKTMVISMFKGLSRRMDGLIETLKRDTVIIKKRHTNHKKEEGRIHYLT